jgi:hypothetical protein
VEERTSDRAGDRGERTKEEIRNSSEGGRG